MIGRTRTEGGTHRPSGRDSDRQAGQREAPAPAETPAGNVAGRRLDERPLSNSVALVTGAGRGIGRATAIALAALGARCVLTARTPGGLEETDDLIRAGDGPAATLLPLDLADGGSIDRLGPTIHERFGRLDILVHAAAALGALTPVPHGTDRDWTAAMAVNLHAPWRLIRTAAPLLERAPAGRAVFLGCDILRSPAAPDAFWGMYAAGKAATAALVRSWADEMRHHAGLRILLHDPGPARTRLRALALPGEDPAALPSPDEAGRVIAGLCLPVRHTP
ncbi:SDR family NAD(P)-dependent oxidoreductase [Rhizosaccharibacter radicis]|uniref:SDR family NAD(P)-dependent oxidoreductase n=1 Tax=Rhizosaccharibacter radicis TaxID=2782605 RepID=A0ABT1VTH0_9PROT|nr:SDR family NAD(P)-dependent oxidoreductase [Acetobacteraceae bacterium KSS12]